MENDETYPAVLEELLRQVVPDGRPVEVLNYGVAGYSTRDEALQYQHRGVGWEPDVVVWIVHRRGDLGLGPAHAPFPIRPYDAPPEVVWLKVTR